MCLRAIKTKHYSQRIPVVGTVGYNIWSYRNWCFKQLSSFQNLRQKAANLSTTPGGQRSCYTTASGRFFEDKNSAANSVIRAGWQVLRATHFWLVIAVLLLQGWEETTDASVTHLLRTTLSKNATDATLNPAPLLIPKDTEKLAKHIALVCDRLGKGAKLTEGFLHLFF